MSKLSTISTRLSICEVIKLALFITLTYSSHSFSAPSSRTSPQPQEIALINAKIYRSENNFAEALLIRGSKVVEIGQDNEILSKISDHTKIVNLKGKTVIPGLIDSHIHAVRAGLSFEKEVNWIGVKKLSTALELIKEKALTSPKNQWIVVAGGWTETQFEEQRVPTQEELDQVALGHPVYIQHFYDSLLLSTKGVKMLVQNNKIRSSKLSSLELLSRLSSSSERSNERSSERSIEQQGWLFGNSRNISDVYDLLPQPSKAQSLRGTLNFFTELNRYGVTGVLDPGGYNLPFSSYESTRALAENNKLTLKIRYSVCAPRKNHELNDLKELTQAIRNKNNPDYFKFNGIGENVTWNMYNNEQPTPEDKQQLKQTLIWAAQEAIPVTLHWNNNASVYHLLDVLEGVNVVRPITKLRWTIAHLSDASEATLTRMNTLGVGWLIQDNLYYLGEKFILSKRVDPQTAIPKIQTALRLGIKVASGTDAHRVNSYNPFVALQWFLDGKTAAGLQMGQQIERPTREQALLMYTQNSAWFSFEESTRGVIEKGYSADLAVLDKDYFTIPTEQVSTIKSLLTIVNGTIVYSAEPKYQQ